MGGHHDHSIDGSLEHNRHVLWTVLLLNASFFGIEVWQGILANSAALIADSMDFLGDSMSYAITLYVLTGSHRARIYSSLFKASMMLIMAAIALNEGIYNLIHNNTPEYITMSWVGLAALIINIICATLLYRTRNHDINMQSVWLCSRNDVVNNLLILVAAALVYSTNSLWPDLAAALFIAGLATKSAITIIVRAKKELQHDH